MNSEPLALAAALFAAIAAGILGWYLWKKPPLTASTKLFLLAGLGVFPIASAGAGNIHGFEKSTTVEFCNSCHVMTPYVRDAHDEKSQSLAAIHSRNPRFGGNSCYVCHENYGMFGTVNTKLEGTRHMWMYFTKYRSANPETAEIALYKPFPNSTCRQCHSTEAPVWSDEPEHSAVVDDIRAGTTSCASEGCHAPAHAVKGRTKK